MPGLTRTSCKTLTSERIASVRMRLPSSTFGSRVSRSRLLPEACGRRARGPPCTQPPAEPAKVCRAAIASLMLRSSDGSIMASHNGLRMGSFSAQSDSRQWVRIGSHINLTRRRQRTIAEGWLSTAGHNDINIRYMAGGACISGAGAACSAAASTRVSQRTTLTVAATVPRSVKEVAVISAARIVCLRRVPHSPAIDVGQQRGLPRLQSQPPSDK